MITGLIRTFLWVHLIGAVLLEILVAMARLISLNFEPSPMGVAAAVMLMIGMIMLGLMLPQAAPILLEPRRAAVARLTVSPRIKWYAMGAVGSFAAEAGLAFGRGRGSRPLGMEVIGECLLPLGLCVLIVGCCLLLVHFSKLRGQGQ